MALLATGIVLVSLFRESVERRFDDTLSVHLSILIRQLAELDDERFPDAQVDLDEPRFTLPLTGWYWMLVALESRELVLSSDSLEGDAVALPPEVHDLRPGVPYTTNAEGPAGEAIRLVARRVAFGDGQWYLVVVTGASQPIEEDTARFAGRLILYLGLFAAVLVGVIFIQWRIGLRPLTQIGRELEEIHAGRAPHVTGRYPTEIMPVADALNTLIDSNHATLERARQHVGNLAHALKTPLSVLFNDAGQDESALAKSVREQAQTMQRQVRYYLERAQMAAKQRMIGAVTDVPAVLERLHRAMARLGERRGVTVHLDIAEPVRFSGEQQDFEEIVGNLVDNGLKWARSQVVIDVRTLSPDQPGAARRFQVTIDDDGPGLTEEQRSAVLSRGMRLDQSKPGSGLGLSIVAELVALYGGGMTLGRADLGGLRVRVVLPCT